MIIKLINILFFIINKDIQVNLYVSRLILRVLNLTII